MKTAVTFACLVLMFLLGWTLKDAINRRRIDLQDACTVTIWTCGRVDYSARCNTGPIVNRRYELPDEHAWVEMPADGNWIVQTFTPNRAAPVLPRGLHNDYLESPR